MNIKAQVNAIIAEVLEMDASGITADQHLRTLPNVDSMKVLQVIVRIEKTFDIELEDEATFRTQTVGEFYDLVTALCDKGVAA
jgi:acyl carrier protein